MKIISYNPIYAPNFEALNLQWLEELFYVEPHDTEVLGNPEKYIIEPGGNIFFILKDEKDSIWSGVYCSYYFYGERPDFYWS